MGTSFKTLMQGLLIFSRLKAEWNKDTPEQFMAKSAYNSALEDLQDFISGYDKGEVSSEFINSLVKLSEKE